MKNNYQERYPNSRILFQFSKQALQYKFSEKVKVIDQDVGAILGYDPADCSHWKKGKKNIKNCKSLHRHRCCSDVGKFFGGGSTKRKHKIKQ